MNGKDLFLGLEYVGDDLIEKAEYGAFSEKAAITAARKKRTSIRRPFMIAAVIAIVLVLVGCGATIYLVLAEEPWASIPRVEGAEVSGEDIRITVTGVTPTGLSYHCDIEGFGPEEKSVFLYTDAPCVIEKRTEDGWQALPEQIVDTAWTADKVLTDGHFDGTLSWAARYGYLDVGVYRVTAPIVEGHEDFVLEFEITEAMRGEGLEMAEDLANREFWHIRETCSVEYGSLENVPDEAKDQYLREDEGADVAYEYWKCGEDYLYLTYDGDQIIMGMMYRDGIKYKLVHEWESNDAPIVGWMPWPDMDLNRLTEWRYVLETTQGQKDISRGSDGSIETVVLTNTEKASNGFDLDVTYTTTLQVLPTSREDIEKMLDGQNTNVWQDFSWEEDQKTYTPREVAFANTTPNPISTAAEALALAERECTVEYTQVKIYRDVEAGIWKIEYQILYGYQGYQYVYLNDDGLTVMVSGFGSKVEEWRDEYPGP